MEKKLKLELLVIQPNTEMDRDPCVNRLLTLLKNKNGVLDAHIEIENLRQPLLCIHYDSNFLSLNQVRQFAEISGAELSNRYGHLTANLSAVLKPGQAKRISQQIAQLPGVIETSVSPIGSLYIEYDKQSTDSDTLHSQTKRFFKAGMPEEKSAPHEHQDSDQSNESTHDQEHGGFLGEKTELIFAILSAVTLTLGWASKRFDLPSLVPNVCYGFSYFFGGYFTAKEALENLKNRKFEIDLLMILAAAGAAFLGEWPEGALLLVLFSLGHALESFAMGRARRAVEALAELAPETALVRRGAEFQEVPVKDLLPGDTILVKPNERIAADGFVTKGESSVDQSPITGESVPVDKMPLPESSPQSERLTPLYRVFAGTINGPGAMEIHVTRASTESTLAKVVDMVNEADARKSPTQLFTDKFERIFVPSILLFASILPLAFLIADETWRESLYRALAVLVAASPCLLTPDISWTLLTRRLDVLGG